MLLFYACRIWLLLLHEQRHLPKFMSIERVAEFNITSDFAFHHPASFLPVL